MATLYKEKQEEDILGKARAMRGRIDEAIMNEMRDLGKASILGVVLSVCGFFILGVLLYLIGLGALARTRLINIQAITIREFFLIYTILTGALMFVGIHYTPKESYYLGLVSRGRFRDDPLTLKDNVDRTHVALGFLVALPNFIRMNAVNLYNYIKAKAPVKNSTLAAAIMLLCQHGFRPELLSGALQPLGFGKSAIEEAINFMHKVEWVESGVDQDNQVPLLVLAEKGKDILRDAEQFV